MRLMLLEFNELSPVLMDKFIAAGKLPNFARLRGESEVWLTDAQEEQENLEPWIQWVTIHSGLTYQEHGIKNLNEGHNLEVDNIWDLLSDARRRVLVCGSMNISYRTPLTGWVIPDPWATDVTPYPEEDFRPYQRFVSANVAEYTRDDLAMGRRDQVEFLAFMARHGLSASTVNAIVRQLAAGRRNGAVGWKRAVLLDKLQFDVFSSYWKRKRPDFATFFLNSTAHFQHVYWRNMEPEHFKVKPEPGEQAVYQDAILYGYEQMDQIVGRVLRLAGPDTTIMFATALSQQPCLTYEEKGGKVIHRPRDFQRLLETVGITGAEVAPLMAEEFRLSFGTEEEAQAGEDKLRRLRYRDELAMGVGRRGTDLMCGCRVWEQVDPDAVLRVEGEDRTVPFDELFYRIDIVKSGMHHPEGMFWVRHPERRHVEHDEKIPLTSIAPMVLKMYGVAVPDCMHREAALA